MRKTLMAGIAVVTLVASALVGTTARQEAASTEPLKPSNTLQPEEAKKALAKQPLRFEANLGQTDSEVRFLSRGSGYSMFLTPSEAVLSLARPDQRGTQEEQSDVVRMRLVGARPEPEVRGTERLPGVSNYILGNDAKSWVTGVPSFGGVNYAGVYPGVDLVYHGDDQGRLEYDFIVAPGADAGPIAMAFSGAKGLRLDSSGELVMATAGGEIRHHKPTLYQDMDGARQAVSGRFVMKGDSQVGFEVGAYDRSRPLVIDPVLAYSTFLGGIGADEGSGIAVDSAGNAYVTGLTTSTNFPRTEGALDLKCGTAGDCDPASNGSLDPSAVRFTLQPDAFVTKLAPGGDSLVYSTYLGGKGADRGLGIAVDANGNAYVTGSTASSDFPTTANAFDTTCGSDGKCDFRASDTASDDPNFGYTKADAFMTKLNPSGSALSYATFIGGRGEEDLAGTATYQTAPGSAPRDLGDPASRPVEFAGGLAVDGETAYVTGTTLSPDFRTTDNAYDRDCGTGTADCNKSQSQIEGGSTGGGVDPCRSPAPRLHHCLPRRLSRDTGHRRLDTGPVLAVLLLFRRQQQ